VTSSALEVRLLYGVTERSASGNCYGDRTQFLPFTALLCPNKSENRTLRVIRVLVIALEASLAPKTTKQPELQESDGTIEFAVPRRMKATNVIQFSLNGINTLDAKSNVQAAMDTNK